jgi:hypothetical protein
MNNAENNNKKIVIYRICKIVFLAHGKASTTLEDKTFIYRVPLAMES